MKVQVLSVLLVALLMVVSASATAETYYFHNDQLGTPQVLTDKDQVVVWKGEYDPFGKVTEVVALVEQNLRFPGQYFDEETGLHYNYFRTYDPGVGRYVESDPIGLAGGLNSYVYAVSNSISFYDGFGLEITGKFRATGFIPNVSSWNFDGLSAPDGGIRTERLEDVYGQLNFTIFGRLNAVVDCKETSDCNGELKREWSMEGSVPVNKLKFSKDLKEPTIPIPGWRRAIMLDSIIRTSQFLDKWNSLILKVGKTILNSATLICRGGNFLK